MKSHLAFLGLAVIAVSGSIDSRADDLRATIRLLRSEVEELRFAFVAAQEKHSTDSKSPSEAAPGRRRLQTSGGGGETVDMSWDGESLNIKSSAAGKSTKVPVLGNLNITGDIYLNGELFQSGSTTTAPTPVPVCSTVTATSDPSWNGAAIDSSYDDADNTNYAGEWHNTRGPWKTLDGDSSGSSNVRLYAYREPYLTYDLGSVKNIQGIQIGNDGSTAGVQETLLQSGTSITGPWTTESTFTGSSRAADRTRCLCFAFYVPA